eukprot:2644013-Pleurochrysis_carterae.AAC.2
MTVFDFFESENHSCDAAEALAESSDEAGSIRPSTACQLLQAWALICASASSHCDAEEEVASHCISRKHAR